MDMELTCANERSGRMSTLKLKILNLSSRQLTRVMIRLSHAIGSSEIILMNSHRKRRF